MKTPRAIPASPHLQVAYRLDALLHTMRAVARAEEQLCSLMHAIQRDRTLPARARTELRQLLEDLPTDICEADRHATLEALGAPPTATPAPATRSTAATAAARSGLRKRSASPPPPVRKSASRRAASPAGSRPGPRPSTRPTPAAKPKARPKPPGRHTLAKASPAARKRTNS